ncbi:cupin domain-containing protein [Aeromicrobium yanjiei]|uniref:DUF861 domain-containing protein n=1 Tax=Aeromicrobium yanjiei TaxID=2662028 RepID=A0A5Q2MHQ7_9ACTN|nr:cupin domain-containing protein [Aeromicrobium yanjiei]QGG40576.1 DUF861 domain-containing protein [Aeromicrobium yanjiei]
MKLDPRTVAVHAYEVAPGRILAGDPRPSAVELWKSPDGSVHGGVWEMSEGTLGGVDVDELVHVVQGRVSVTFDDTGEGLELAAGDVATFTRGRTMTWVVSERFRAVFAGAV